MTPLVEFYKALLQSVDCVIDENDYVLYHPSKIIEARPVKVFINKIEKNLVLPTKKILHNGDWTTIIAFHPASESIVCGQSEVLNTLILLMATKIHDSVQNALASIINLATNTGMHDKLNLAQRELLSQFDAIDDNVNKLSAEIIKKNTGIIGKNPLLSLHLDKGGIIDDESYSRICRLIPYVLKSKDNFCGVTTGTLKAKATIYTIFEYIFPKQCIYGSNSTNMPYFIALLTCYYHTAKHLNAIKSLLGKHGIMREIPIQWHDQVKDINKLAKQYLPQPFPGNTGIPALNKSEEPEEEIKITKTSDIKYMNDEISKPTTINTTVTKPEVKTQTLGSLLRESLNNENRTMYNQQPRGSMRGIHDPNFISTPQPQTSYSRTPTSTLAIPQSPYRQTTQQFNTTPINTGYINIPRHNRGAV